VCIYQERLRHQPCVVSSVVWAFVYIRVCCSVLVCFCDKSVSVVSAEAHVSSAACCQQCLVGMSKPTNMRKALLCACDIVYPQCVSVLYVEGTVVFS